MTGKERILTTLQHNLADQIPWVPFVGVHAGHIKGYTAEEVLKDADKLYESLMEAHKLYQPDGMPVIFDLQIEAEILGCELVWAEDCPPSVKTHPLEDVNSMPCKCKLPTKEKGRIPLVLDVMKRMKTSVGNNTALYGLICGPFTLASHLRGNNLFMDMILDENYVKELMEFCTEVSLKMIDFYTEEGMDIIAVVDPLVSQISPDHFKLLCHDSFSTIFDYIKAKGAKSSFFVCGNATRQMEVMCETHPDAISIDENVDIKLAKQITDKFNITIGGNIPLTTLMLHGTQQDNMKYVVDMIDNISHDNLIISPGCDMPYSVPKENAIAIGQTIRETEQVREMIKNYEAKDENIFVEIPDYKNLEKPFMEVFTLDSSSCAACTYMMDAANVAKEHFEDKIDVIEYKFTEKINIARCKKMGVTNLPSIYINGQLKWSSIIPSREELFETINELL